MHLVASIRWWLARARWPVWAALAGLALTAGWITGRHVTALDGARRSWGQARPVWVATVTVEPGQPVRAERRSYPAAVVPPSAVTSLGDTPVAQHRIAAGSMLTGVDLAPAGAAALIPAGWIAVPVADESATFRPGDSVVAFADGHLIATGVVTAVTAQHVTLAVPAPSAAGLAAASADGRDTLGLRATPPGSPATR